MNLFEEQFFEKYIPEGQEIISVAHKHFLVIFLHLCVWIGIGLGVPTFLYYQSEFLQQSIPLIILQTWCILLFIKVVYDVFDWYNDAWIITNETVVELNWKLFGNESNSVRYENIEGIEVQQEGIIDTLFQKGNIVIHKIGDDRFVLEEAYHPYNITEILEEVSDNYRESGAGSDKFEMVVETLGGMMEEYLEKKTYSSKKQKETPKYKNIDTHGDDAIDLR
ncbi:hypothetical protein MK079_05005 [Candidatus Gracilibacteria bacterium]|nr:hypothetical protein [Candidatus Gracilibacteria bacterium]